MKDKCAPKKKEEEDAKKAEKESQARVDAANLIMADYNYKKTLGDATFQDELAAFDKTRELERQDMVAKKVSGDALLAYATIVQLKTGNEILASIIGTVAAGLACQKEGNVTITPTEIIDYINKLEKLSELVAS